MLSNLGFPQDGPTPIFEDNKSAIDIVNSNKPTERSRHIDIRFFAILTRKLKNRDTFCGDKLCKSQDLFSFKGLLATIFAGTISVGPRIYLKGLSGTSSSIQ